MWVLFSRFGFDFCFEISSSRSCRCVFALLPSNRFLCDDVYVSCLGCLALWHCCVLFGFLQRFLITTLRLSSFSCSACTLVMLVMLLLVFQPSSFSFIVHISRFIIVYHVSVGSVFYVFGFFFYSSLHIGCAFFQSDSLLWFVCSLENGEIHSRFILIHFFALYFLAIQIEKHFVFFLWFWMIMRVLLCSTAESNSHFNFFVLFLSSSLYFLPHWIVSRE